MKVKHEREISVSKGWMPLWNACLAKFPDNNIQMFEIIRKKAKIFVSHSKTRAKKIHELEGRTIPCDITPYKIAEMLLENIGGSCYLCYSNLTDKNVTVDHRIPLSHKNGSNQVQNMKVICDVCNRRKGELSETSYSELLYSMYEWDESERNYVLNQLSLRPAWVGGRRR